MHQKKKKVFGKSTLQNIYIQGYYAKKYGAIQSLIHRKEIEPLCVSIFFKMFHLASSTVNLIIQQNLGNSCIWFHLLMNWITIHIHQLSRKKKNPFSPKGNLIKKSSAMWLQYFNFILMRPGDFSVFFPCLEWMNVSILTLLKIANLEMIRSTTEQFLFFFKSFKLFREIICMAYIAWTPNKICFEIYGQLRDQNRPESF